MTGRFEQLELFELTAVVCETAKRIDEGEVVNAEDKLDLAEQMAEARRRMPANQEYGNWWRTTGLTYSLQWRAVLVAAGKRISRDGRPVIKPLDNGGEFSIERFAETGDGWITGDKPASIPTSGPDDEWYTPPWLFDALGLRFDLDVCAPVDPQLRTVPARRVYTIGDDGLSLPWDGLIWCNPPYSNPTPWAERMIEHDNGLLLSHVPINGLWALRAWWRCSALRLLQGMEFLRPDGELQRPGYWLHLVAFGDVAGEAVRSMTVDDWVRERFQPSIALVPWSVPT